MEAATEDASYILAEPQHARLIEPAPVINHTDRELTLIEELVGRLPPFADRIGDEPSGPLDSAAARAA